MPKRKQVTSSATIAGRKTRSPTISVIVTKELIEESMRRKSGFCMIAEAIKRSFPEFSNVAVDLQTIRFSDRKRGLRYTYLTPRPCQKALVLWDRAISIPPFPVKLRAAHVTSTTTGSRNIKRKLSHKFGKRRINAKPSDKRDGTVPETLGGKPIPHTAHESHSSRREYGMRAFTLDDVIPLDQKPTGKGQALDA